MNCQFLRVFGLVGIGALAGCVSAPPEIISQPAPTTAEMTNLETAQRVWLTAIEQKYGAQWERENGGEDPFAAGVAAYHLGLESEKASWSKAAIAEFDQVLAERPASAQACAYRGASAGLVARDYPVKGVLTIVVPGPGMVRLNLVRQAKSDLNLAAEQSPNDPTIRLLRAATYVGMPAVFGGRDEGLADFDTLERWITHPEENESYRETLLSSNWLDEYYLNRARSMDTIKDEEEARRAWSTLAARSNDPIVKRLAELHLAMEP